MMATSPRSAPHQLRNYIVVTGAYWADTLTDGAIRTLVLFYFYELGYSALQVALLFLLYEIFGVITNLVGGWLGARFGLTATLFGGLATQVLALGMLGIADPIWLAIPAIGVPYVMVAQALSGIAKDLTKMSSKSALKVVVADGAQSTLFRWVTLLTGSKNALKGVGFFLGALLLSVIGFRPTLVLFAGLVLIALITAALLLRGGLGSSNKQAKFREIFSRNQAVNLLAAARLFLFASRDVWFVVGLPVFLRSVLGWSFWQAGGFLAIWTIGYGFVQAAAPRVLRRNDAQNKEPDGRMAAWLAFGLAAFPTGIALALMAGVAPTIVVVGGLLAFGVMFALNSAVHSYLILAYTDGEKAAMNVGFYYTANALGRLAGTVLSGWLYTVAGLIGCLWVAVGCVLAAGIISLALPINTAPRTRPIAFGEGGE